MGVETVLKFVNHESDLFYAGEHPGGSQNHIGSIEPDHKSTRVVAWPKARALLPGQSALLVLDMQEYFLAPEAHAFIPSAPAIIPNLQKLIAVFEKRNRPVIFTRHLNTPENSRAMSRWWRDLITSENPLSSISAKLDTQDHTVLIKSQYDAFYQTQLARTLHNLNISQVIISGVMTHLCCETTARSAFVQGFDVFFMADATATYNQDFHLASLRNLAHGFATLQLTSQVLERFSQNEASIMKGRHES
jgi:isochorismate hydrolase